MLKARSIADLQDHFGDIEKTVQSNGNVLLTKNGYGSMVLLPWMSIFGLSALQKRR